MVISKVAVKCYQLQATCFPKGKYKSWWYQNRVLKQPCSAARDIPGPGEYFYSEILQILKEYFKKKKKVSVLDYALYIKNGDLIKVMHS